MVQIALPKGMYIEENNLRVSIVGGNAYLGLAGKAAKKANILIQAFSEQKSLGLVIDSSLLKFIELSNMTIELFCGRIPNAVVEYHQGSTLWPNWRTSTDPHFFGELMWGYFRLADQRHREVKGHGDPILINYLHSYRDGKLSASLVIVNLLDNIANKIDSSKGFSQIHHIRNDPAIAPIANYHTTSFGENRTLENLYQELLKDSQK